MNDRNRLHLLMMSHQFDTIQEEISILDKTYTINRIGDIDKLFDALLAKGSDHADVLDEKIPYWAELWPSAIAMSQYLLENKDLLQGKSIIEIGSGLGLPSIVAGEFASKIVCTDYIQESLDFAKANYLLNYPTDEKIIFDILDWRNIVDVQTKYDIIIASDVAYERKAIADLENCLMQLAHENSLVILSEPNRDMAVEFLARLKKENKIKEAKEYIIPLRGINSKVMVYRLQLK